MEKVDVKSVDVSVNSLGSRATIVAIYVNNALSALCTTTASLTYLLGTPCVSNCCLC